jgi:hypothetical protein
MYTKGTFMRRIVGLTFLMVACIALTGCGAGFKEFSPDPKFKVLMPGTPKEQSQDLLGLKLKMWIYEERNGGYAVAITDIGTIPSEELKVRLDGARDGAVRNVGGTLISESEKTLADKYPGREIIVELPNGKGFNRQRFYLVAGRLYQMMSIGKDKKWIESADSTKFLDSLTILSE